MTKCPYCGFDTMEDCLRIEGAPCGVPSYNKESKKPIPNTTCSTFTCCPQAWKEHCKKCHPEYYTQELMTKEEKAELEQQEIQSKYEAEQEQERLKAEFEAEEAQRQANMEAEAQAMEEEGY